MPPPTRISCTSARRCYSPQRVCPRPDKLSVCVCEYNHLFDLFVPANPGPRIARCSASPCTRRWPGLIRGRAYRTLTGACHSMLCRPRAARLPRSATKTKTRNLLQPASLSGATGPSDAHRTYREEATGRTERKRNLRQKSPVSWRERGVALATAPRFSFEGGRLWCKDVRPGILYGMPTPPAAKAPTPPRGSTPGRATRTPTERTLGRPFLHKSQITS